MGRSEASGRANLAPMTVCEWIGNGSWKEPVRIRLLWPVGDIIDCPRGVAIRHTNGARVLITRLFGGPLLVPLSRAMAVMRRRVMSV